MGGRIRLAVPQTPKPGPRPRRLFNVFGASPRPEIPPLPSIVDAMLGAIDVMQQRIAQSRLVSEAPDVLLTPSLVHLGSFEYHRAAQAIAEGREAVAQMLPAIQDALAV